MLTVYQQITIRTLNQQGEKNVQIARQLGCHRNTVRNVLQRGQVIKKQTRVKSSCFDPYRQQIKEWLEQKVTRRRIHELINKEYGIKRSYDNLCKYIQKHLPKPVTAYGVQVCQPGEEAEVDFGYLGLLPNFEGKLVKAWGFAVILSYSRLGCWGITYDQKLETLVRQLKLAFAYFGGVPKRLKIDNMRAAILTNQHYDLEFNQDFLEFAAHYGTVIVPCTPYHPWEKGKVEAGIKYIQGNFMLARKFKDGRELALQLRDWRDHYANQRIHGTTKKVPWEVFRVEEKSSLLPLPAKEFAYFNRCVRKVGRNCHLHFGSNYYSVPAVLVGKEVTVRYNDYLLRVIYQGEQVALHKLSCAKGDYITVRTHLPDWKVYSETEYQARYEEKMVGIGENAHKFFQLVLRRKEGYWNRTVRGILGLVAQYGEEVVEASLARALYFNATDLVTIKNIVIKRLYELEREPRLPIAPVETEIAGDGLSRELSYYQL